MKGTCNRQDPLGYSLKGPVPALKMPVTMMPKGSHLPTTPHTQAIQVIFRDSGTARKQERLALFPSIDGPVPTMTCQSPSPL